MQEFVEGVTTCISCGCDDLHACYDEERMEACHWVRLDRERGIGVCSACKGEIIIDEDLVSAWDRVEREFEEEDIPELGPCCICEREDGVRNILMLNKRVPISGHGWGCFVCGLPCDGASAVLCDSCFEAVRGDTARILWACRGYPAEDGWIPIEELTEPFDHDAHFHSASEDAYEDM